MKHLILFERFKSLKLSKTLGYIKDDSNFLEYVKRIAKLYDFPSSELSDDMFEYLPFNPALKVNAKIDTTPKKCDGESEWIPGEFCDKGKIKRTWGTKKSGEPGTRIIDCSKCGGTGFLKPTTSPDIYCVKFWFNSDGKLIHTTGSDGTSYDGVNKTGININDFNRGASYTPSELRTSGLKTGDKVIMLMDSREHIGTIFLEGIQYFFIGDSIRGGGSPQRGNWRQYGSRSWGLGGTDHGNIIHLVPKPIDEEPIENPYSWNHKLEIGRYGGLSLTKGRNVESDLKDAHFAIILFLDKIKGSEYKKVSVTKQEREESKKGATKLISDENVRKENIENYIKKLSGKFNLADGISGITTILPRVMGGNSNILYYVYSGRNLSYINDSITYLYNFIKAKSDDDRKDSVDNIKYSLNNIYKENMVINSNISNNKKFVKEQTKSEDLLNILDALDKLNDKIFNKINVSVDNIEDIEVIYFKLKSIRETLSSSRYAIRLLNHYMSYITRKDGARNSLYTITDSYVPTSRYKDILDDIEIVGKIVDKL